MQDEKVSSQKVLDSCVKNAGNECCFMVVFDASSSYKFLCKELVDWVQSLNEIFFNFQLMASKDMTLSNKRGTLSDRNVISNWIFHFNDNAVIICLPPSAKLPFKSSTSSQMFACVKYFYSSTAHKDNIRVTFLR